MPWGFWVGPRLGMMGVCGARLGIFGEGHRFCGYGSRCHLWCLGGWVTVFGAGIGVGGGCQCA